MMAEYKHKWDGKKVHTSVSFCTPTGPLVPTCSACGVSKVFWGWLLKNSEVHHGTRIYTGEQCDDEEFCAACGYGSDELVVVLPISKSKEEHDAKVVKLFKDWTPLREDDELATLYEESRNDVTMPSGAGVVMHRGKYSNIPIIVAGGGDMGDRLFMKAHGINRQNRKANEKRLSDLIKSIAKHPPVKGKVL